MAWREERRERRREISVEPMIEILNRLNPEILDACVTLDL